MVSLPFTNGFYQDESLPLSNQQCVNFYIGRSSVPTRAQEYLIGTPGILSLATTGEVNQKNRGSRIKNGVGYFVNGTTLYRLDRSIAASGEQTISYTSLGTISGTGRVSMSDNGTQLIIIEPGGKGYIYNEDAGTPFQEITDVNFTANGNPQHVIFVDGYFVVTTDTKKWIVSALNDGLTWDALDRSTAESDPDTVVAPVKVNNQIYILGSITTEGFFNPVTTGAGFPFVRNNVFLDIGCAAPFSIVKANQTFYMVGKGKDETPAIWEFAGTHYKKISTPPIDNILSQYTDSEVEDIYGLFYGEKGNYYVSFTLSDTTFTFSLLTRKWVEQKSRVSEESTAWRVSSLISIYNKTIVFDSIDGRIGELSSEVYKEYDENIVSVFSTQAFENDKGFTLPAIELLIESGVGNSDAPNPRIGLSISKDGKIFNNDRLRSMGKVGEFNRRLFWRRNGRTERFAILRFLVSAPVKKRILGLEAA